METVVETRVIQTSTSDAEEQHDHNVVQPTSTQEPEKSKFVQMEFNF